jgi:hypothetical protein
VIRFALAVFVLGVAAGCKPVLLDDFCPRFAAEYCALTARCCPSIEVDQRGCELLLEGRCRLVHQSRSYSENTTVNPAAIESCLNGMKETAATCPRRGISGFEPDFLKTCRGVVEGTLALGQGCSARLNDCAPGLYCLGGICTAPPGEGQSCQLTCADGLVCVNLTLANGQQRVSCLPVRGEEEACNPNESICGPNLFCDGRHCVPQLSENEQCLEDQECLSASCFRGRCASGDGYCAAAQEVP